MKNIKLVGSFKSESGGKGIRIIDCQISATIGETGISSNIEIDDSLKSSIEIIINHVKTYATQIANAHFDNIGVEIDVDDKFDVNKLEQTSFGLPIYVALLCDILNIEPNHNICGTGEVLESGKLGPVSNINLKEAMAFDTKNETFLFPSTVTHNGLRGIPIKNAFSAFLFWIDGIQLLFNKNVQNNETLFFEIFFKYIEGHFNRYFNPNLGDLIHTIFKENKNINLNFNTVQHFWIVNCLKETNYLPASSFRQLCQLLEPRHQFDNLWNDPIKREKYILEIIEIISNQVKDIPIIAIQCMLSFLKFIGKNLDLAFFIKTSNTFRNHIIEFQEKLYSPNYSDYERRSIKRHLSMLMSFIGDINLVGKLFDNIPEQFDDVYLQMDFQYQDNNFNSVKFSFPQHKDIAPCLINNPVALFDSSANLPTKLRVIDWDITKSAIDSVPCNSMIYQTFGNNNLFKIPPLIEDGLETKIFWGDGTATWPPSIDTLHLLGSLKKMGILGRDQRYNNILDLGCGTGVVGIAIGINSITNNIDFMDIEPGARVTTSRNILANFSDQNSKTNDSIFDTNKSYMFDACSVRFLDQELEELLRSDYQYDLTLCTPPYLPYVDMLRDTFMWRAVAGTDLLRFTIKNAHRFSKKTIIQFSDIALPEIGDLIINIKKVDEHIVGFRIPPVLRYFQDDADYKTRAVGEKWLKLVEPYLIDMNVDENNDIVSDHHGFRYFHKIGTYII